MVSTLLHAQSLTHLKFHPGQLVYLITEIILDDSPSDLVVRLSSMLYSLSCQIVEGNNIIEHPNCLVEWTVTIIWCI